MKASEFAAMTTEQLEKKIAELKEEQIGRAHV